eukprot:TRINITY_DN4253_c0_g1_i1.p1 TRINITY_DN4253_c0_g1~~TRINITY_DN4253_c0_g1_i1.p1  ORF type:complete len:204 (+),score=46.35 TRINITY_DN4253_c0_g1_i1:188-799(+)
MIEEYDNLFKILLIGESGVGKSSFLHRYVECDFTEMYLSTIGVDFKMNTMNVEGKKIKLHVFDTAGQERFHTITTSYYRNADALILMFDLTDRDSFNKINYWLSEIETHSRPNTKIFIVGNKSDLFDLRQVNEEDIEIMRKRLNLPYLETSTKMNTNVNETFCQVTKLLLDSNVTPNQNINSKKLRLNQKPVKDVKGCTCTIL